jgi:hypothetical protein
MSGGAERRFCALESGESSSRRDDMGIERRSAEIAKIRSLVATRSVRFRRPFRAETWQNADGAIF